MASLGELPDDPDKIRQAVRLFRDAADEEEPGTYLKTARQYLDWSQADLGEALDLSIHVPDAGQRQCRTLGHWETGSTSPSWESRSKLLDLADELEELADTVDDT